MYKDQRIIKYMAKPDATKLYDTYRSWKTDLEDFHPQFKKNRQLYEFYKDEAIQTDADVSMNTQFAIVQATVSRFITSPINVTSRAEGQNGALVQKLGSYVSALAKAATSDRKMARRYGNFMKRIEESFVDYLVTGNCAAEMKYDHELGMAYPCPLLLESVIFNPSKNLETSGKWFVEKYVGVEDLKSNEYNPQKKEGIYKNVRKIIADFKDQGYEVEDHDSSENYTGDKKVMKKVPPILLLEYWNGYHLITLAVTNKKGGLGKNSYIVRDIEDPYDIEDHPLHFGMLYMVNGRPYAYGEMDSIYKQVRAQDTLLNQAIDATTAQLRPGYLVNNPDVSTSTVQILLKYGGVAYGNVADVGKMETGSVAPQAFNLINVLQQSQEKSNRFSPYASGTPSSASDQTKGTKGGILALQQASEPTFDQKVKPFVEMFLEPIINNSLRMMAANPKKGGYDVMVQGQLMGNEWVKATANLILGKPTTEDLKTLGVLSEEEMEMYTNTYELNEFGEPTLVPIDGAEKAEIFNASWILSVDIDSDAANDDMKTIEKYRMWAEMAQTMGVPIDNQKVVMAIGRKILPVDPEDFVLTPQQGMPGMMPGMEGMQDPMMQQQMPPEMMPGMVPPPDPNMMMPPQMQQPNMMPV